MNFRRNRFGNSKQRPWVSILGLVVAIIVLDVKEKLQEQKKINTEASINSSIENLAPDLIKTNNQFSILSDSINVVAVTKHNKRN